jgi:FKBP-type peptidyl-prolyl cis-trans isomerase 2
MLVGRRQGEVEHVRLASEAGFGQMDLSKLNISRLNV